MSDDIAASAIDSQFAPRARPDVAWVELDGQVVAFDPVRMTSYVLNATAGLIWQLLDGSDTVEVLSADLAAAFGADLDQIRSDVLTTVRRFGDQGLLAGVTGQRSEDGSGDRDPDRSPSRFLLGPESP
ncbi:PqqD family peptide modification chaperone [Acidimicrobiaceae bacterium USS-CC1]|uniref:PqqD family peptide modification chaperone n=1 Tax=Acidiferrimicrobium australe TaxID=2664430 RepID=A0ABW9QZ80_9ACTN|nr:PqqD family peptide modification chaperone [Acidiferrimicrobium australe]